MNVHLSCSKYVWIVEHVYIKLFVHMCKYVSIYVHISEYICIFVIKCKNIYLSRYIYIYVVL